jgi:hypothetical protein
VGLVADLAWSGNDGFDPKGMRMAWVVRCFDLGASSAVQGPEHSGPGFAAPRWYWEAFVAHDGRFDQVVVGDEPGRWAKKDEAKAAAEAAHRIWTAEEPSSDSAKVAAEEGTQAAHAEGAGDRDRQATGVLGHLRGLLRAWRTVYRSDR